MMNYTYNVEETDLSYDDMIAYAQIITAQVKEPFQHELSDFLARTHGKRDTTLCEIADIAAKRMWRVNLD
jgi:hypothetical protein